MNLIFTNTAFIKKSMLTVFYVLTKRHMKHWLAHKCKVFRYYHASEIQVWDTIQLMLYSSNYWGSHSLILEVTQKLPQDGIFETLWLWDDQKKYPKKIHVDYIYRNYRLDPIIPQVWDHRKKTFTSFIRKPC